MKKTILSIILIIVLMFLTSCSSQKAKTDTRESTNEEDETTFTEETTASAGAIFTYNTSKIREQGPPEIYLTFSTEPVQIPKQGFVKFKGAVTGKRAVALLEVGGRGVVVSKGDKVGTYMVDVISAEYIRLKKENKNVL